jgi:UTP:GlnB (protein PII) uridylyltransferase
MDLPRLKASVLTAAQALGVDLQRADALTTEAPETWWAQGNTAALATDVKLLGPGIGPEGVRIRISPTPETALPHASAKTPSSGNALWDLAIVTTDRPGAFSATCATLSDFGISVVRARVASWTQSALALQHLTVEPIDAPIGGEPDWPTVGLALRAALTQPPLGSPWAPFFNDGCTISTLIHHDCGEKLGSKPSMCDMWTVVVTGPDTLGLLASITRTFTALGADILSAEVTSSEGMAQDAFTLRLSNPEGIAALRAMSASRQ